MLRSSTNPRRDAARKQALLTEAQAQRAVGYVYPADVRYRERSTVERVNGRLKDEFGARHVRAGNWPARRRSRSSRVRRNMRHRVLHSHPNGQLKLRLAISHFV